MADYLATRATSMAKHCNVRRKAYDRRCPRRHVKFSCVKDIRHLVNELDRHCDVGDGPTAIAVARRLLRSGGLSPEGFKKAVWSLGEYVENLGHWRKTIERAFERFDTLDQKLAAAGMFSLCVYMERWDEAYEFMLIEDLDPGLMNMCMWTLLKTGNDKAAGDLAKSCMRELALAEDEFEKHTHMDTLGTWHARSGRWDEAQKMWEANTSCEIHGDSAIESLINLHAVRGLIISREAIAYADCALEKNAIARPPVNDNELRKLRNKFLGHAKHLARVVPKDEQWAFGL